MLSVRPPWRAPTSFPNNSTLVIPSGFSNGVTGVGITASSANRSGSNVANGVTLAVGVCDGVGVTDGVAVREGVGVKDGVGVANANGVLEGNSVGKVLGVAVGSGETATVAVAVAWLVEDTSMAPSWDSAVLRAWFCSSIACAYQ